MSQKYENLAGISENQAKFLHLSSWEAIDVAHSQHVLLETLVQEYNKALPRTSIVDNLGRNREYTAGKLRAAQISLAQKLIWLAICQAEETRKTALQGNTSVQQRYLLYFADHADSIPVTTNRGEIRRLLGCTNGIASIWRHINQLIDAGIILSKANTSRQRREVVEKNGNRTIIIEAAKNGRGDFVLWISKAVFKQRIRPEFVEIVPIFQQTGETENSNSEANQISKLEQEYPYNKETKKEEKNNLEKQVGKGVASPHKKLMEAKASDDKKRNDSSKNKNYGGEPASGKKIHENLSAESIPQPQRAYEPFSLEKYHRDMRRNDRIRAFIPEKPMAYWVFILYHQLVEMLYPHLSEQHLNGISEQVKGMLELHIRRIEIASCKSDEEHIQKAACRISRAIYLAFAWMKGKNFKLYEPLSYLRLDDDMKNGLRDVVDKWLPEEDKRRALRADANSNLMKWQKAEAFAEDLFRGVMYTLKKSGLNQSGAVFEESQFRLNKKFDQIGLSDATRTKIRDSFRAKCLNIFHAIQKATFEEEDTTWKNFLRYQKMTKK